MPVSSRARRGTARSAGAHIRRKNLNIDQTKLDRVVELLGARSETEAVDQALDLLLFREELIAGVRGIAGAGGVENYFDDELAG